MLIGSFIGLQLLDQSYFGLSEPSVYEMEDLEQIPSRSSAHTFPSADESRESPRGSLRNSPACTVALSSEHGGTDFV